MKGDARMNMLYDQDTKGSRQDTVVMELAVLAEGNLTVELPSQLSLMSESDKDTYYPYENRPETILADSAGSIQMTFQRVNKKLLPEETGRAAEAVRSFTEKRYPHSEMSPMHLFYGGELPVGWFAMALEIGGQSRLHVKAVFPLHGQLCLATATYPEQEQSKWVSVLKYIFATLHERGDTDGGYQ